MAESVSGSGGRVGYREAGLGGGLFARQPGFSSSASLAGADE
jgi:hypothetical protein